MKIRNADLGDSDTIYSIETKCFPIEEAAKKEQLEQRIEYFSECFWVLEIEGEIVGFINGMASDTPDLQDIMYENAALHEKDGEWQMIFGLDVLPEYRCKGYASMLIRHLIESAEKSGKRGTVLTCKRKLIGFYEKFGFRNEGVSKSVHGGAVWYQMRLTFE